jgi:hydrogenase/urease accessory protein HupE
MWLISVFVIKSVFPSVDERHESGRGQPHSKTLRKFEAFPKARQRLGVRLSSAAFHRFGNLWNLGAIPYTALEIQLKSPLPRPAPHRMGRGRSIRRLLSCIKPIFPITGPVLFTLLLIAVPIVACAHDPGLSTATVRLTDKQIEVTMGYSIIDAAEIVEIDRDRDAHISKEELADAAIELQNMGTNALEVKVDGRPIAPSGVKCSFDPSDNTSVRIIFSVPQFSKLEIRSKWLALLQPGHRQFLSVQNQNGDALAERLLSQNSDSITVQVDAIAPALAPANHAGSFADFLVMGVKHIWTGYDHLLFLFGLLIVTRDFASSFKIITCFTIAHSITLAVATLSLVQFSSHIVEPLIAASIVYVGIENLLRGDDPKGRWLLTFAFGLIHGFGFASVLRELGVGVNGTGIAVPLVSFNLGVELGQIVIAALVLPVIWKLRTKPAFVSRWVPACSIVVVLLGGYWLIQRVWF